MNNNYDGTTTAGDYLLDKWRNNNINTNSSISNSHIPYSSGYGITFFFERRQHHYEVINDLIFSKLIELKNNNNKSDLFDYLRLNELGILNELIYKDAKIHLKKHKRYLPQKIEEVRQNIKKHNLEVSELDIIIDDFIHSNFSIRPYNSIFPYLFTTHVKSQSIKIWYDSIKNIKDKTDITKINKNIDIEIGKPIITYSGEHDRILNINGHQIGNGYYANSAQDLKKIFITILKNEEILQKLEYLLNNNLVMNKDIESIVEDVCNISESIKRGYYNKKLNCCPRLLKFIPKPDIFGFIHPD